MKNRLIVNFGSLTIGSHEFTFELTNENWAQRGSERIKGGNVDVLLNVEKSERQLAFNYKIEGKVELICDNCLSNLDYPISDSILLFVKLSNQEMEDEVELVHLPANSTQWDMTDHACDSVELSLPMKATCSDSINRKECDAEYMEKLHSKDGEENNSHPEWEKLKDLFKQN